MDDNNEFLLYLYQSCEMGIISTKQLLSILNSKENKIKVKVQEELNEYESLLLEIQELFDQKGIEPQKSNIMSKVGSTIGIRMDLMKDNSDAKIADMLIQGYTMGILEITKKVKKYSSCITKEEKKLADKINKIQSKNIKDLQKYL